MIRLQAAGLGAHRQRRDGRRVVDPDRRRPEQAGRARQLGIVVVAQLAAPQALRVHQPFGAEQALHQLVLGHFEREDADADVVLDGGVLDHVQNQRGLSHRRAGGHDDQVGALEARGQPVQVHESARDPGHGAGSALELLDALHRGPDQLLQPDELLRAPELRHLEDAVLRVVQHIAGHAAAFIRFLDDGGGGFDQPPQQRLVAYDAPVVLDVGGGRHDVDEGADVLHAADPIEVAALDQLVAQRDRIHDVAALGEGGHGAEQQPVSLAIEHRIVEDFRRLQGRVLIEQHGAEHRLLRFVAPRSLAAGVLAFSRGDGGRYGRHPRSVASNWGSGAVQLDGR